MKSVFKIIGIGFLLLVLFRGAIYRTIIKYSEIGTRKVVEIKNKDLVDRIEGRVAEVRIDIEQIRQVSDEITKEVLNFKGNPASSNPNELIKSREANCIGYSAMFNSIANYLIRENKLEGKIEASHKIGHLDLFGINLHQFFENPFYHDHDFNEIRNNQTGKLICVDPTLSDYFGIETITRR